MLTEEININANTNPGINLTDSFQIIPISGIKKAANKGIAINNTGLPTILDSLFRQFPMYYDVYIILSPMIRQQQ